MTILRERTVWRLMAKRTRVDTLAPEEQANVRAALRFLRIKHGGSRKLAPLLGVLPRAVKNYASPKRAVVAGLAVRLAKLAGVPAEDILRGTWPPAGACPWCGRLDQHLTDRPKVTSSPS